MHLLENTLCQISALIKVVDEKKSYKHLDAIAETLLCVASMSHYEYAPTDDSIVGFSTEDRAVANSVEELAAVIEGKK